LLIASICLVYPLILAVSWIPDDFRTDLLDFECFPVSRAFLHAFLKNILSDFKDFKTFLDDFAC
jgi:hypothetical protein